MGKLSQWPLQQGKSKEKGLQQGDQMTSVFPAVLTALQVRREAVKEALALLPEEQKHVLLCSSFWLTAAYL